MTDKEFHKELESWNERNEERYYFLRRELIDLMKEYDRVHLKREKQWFYRLLFCFFLIELLFFWL